MSLITRLGGYLLAMGIGLASCSNSHAQLDSKVNYPTPIEKRERKLTFQPKTHPVIPGESKPKKDLEDKIAGVEVLDIAYVSQRESDKVATQEPKFATTDERVWLYAVIKARTKEGIIYYTEADQVKLGKREVPKSQLRKWNLPGQLPIKWFKVEADSNGLWYVRNNQINCPEGIEECKEVSYKNIPWKEGWVVKADVHPTTLEDPFPESETGLGVMRYGMMFTFNGNKYSTPGASSIKTWKDTLHLPRVSFHNNQGDWTDYLFELFNAPYIWGSTQEMVDEQVGSDCADLIAYARRRSGKNQEYTWSGGLKESTFKIHLKQVKRGDLLFFPRHVAVFYRDNGDHVLGEEDLMVHTFLGEPEMTAIDPYPLEIRRWKE